MNPKRIIIISTMAFTIAIASGIWNEQNAVNVHFFKFGKSSDTHAGSSEINHPNLRPAPNQDGFHQVLGVSSNEEIHDALYSGKTLANIAIDNHKDVQKVIDWQVTELGQQLDSRLANGHLSPRAYLAHKSELVDIITNSVYGKA